LVKIVVVTISKNVVTIMLIMPGTSILPGARKLHFGGNFGIPQTIQILDTPTGEVCCIYGEERSLTSKLMFNVKYIGKATK
jgi:hypothetical protein